MKTKSHQAEQTPAREQAHLWLPRELVTWLRLESALSRKTRSAIAAAALIEYRARAQGSTT